MCGTRAINDVQNLTTSRLLRCYTSMTSALLRVNVPVMFCDDTVNRVYIHWERTRVYFARGIIYSASGVASSWGSGPRPQRFLPMSLSIYTNSCNYQSVLSPRQWLHERETERDSSAGHEFTTRTLLCKTRAGSYSISNMVSAARARPIGQLHHTNEMVTNRIVNKSMDLFKIRSAIQMDLTNRQTINWVWFWSFKFRYKYVVGQDFQNKWHGAV